MHITIRMVTGIAARDGHRVAMALALAAIGYGIHMGIIQSIATDDSMWLARGLSIWSLLTLTFWATALPGERLLMSAFMLMSTGLALAAWRLAIWLIDILQSSGPYC